MPPVNTKPLAASKISLNCRDQPFSRNRSLASTRPVILRKRTQDSSLAST